MNYSVTFSEINFTIIEALPTTNFGHNISRVFRKYYLLTNLYIGQWH